MSRSRSALLTLAVVTMMVLSVGATGTVGATTSGNDTTAEDPTFVVQQGGACYEPAALGDGTQSVESFYNYSADFDWSSEGTQHLQENQVSNLFIYNGSEGYSLVFVNDKHGDGPHGSTISMTVAGQTENGTWAVEDDDYQGRDDNFDHYGTHSEIDWKWAPDRTDGGAYRGLAVDDATITVDPAFNEEADAWGSWPWSGDADNRTEAWKLLGQDGTTVTELSMTENVTVTTGACDQALTASLSASPSSATTNESVTFDASASTGDAEIVEYRWDYDGDGTVDATTDAATTSHAYANADEYHATVTVVDAEGNEDTATATVSVTADDGDGGDDAAPTAKLDVQEKTTVGTTVALDASASDDDTGIVEYRWDVEGDGTVDETTSEAVLKTSYDAKGEYEPTVTAVDEAGNADTATATITVVENDTESPMAKLDAPSEATAGQKIAFDASASTDNVKIAAYHWDFDGDGTPEKKTSDATVKTSYDAKGEYTAEVTVIDSSGNKDVANATVTVTADDADTEPPSVTLDVPEKVTVDEEFTAKATDVSDESGVAHVCWYVNGEVGPDGKTLTHTFTETGDHTVSLRVVDEVGNEQTITRTVTVVADDHDSSPPTNGGSDDSDSSDDTSDSSSDTSDDSSPDISVTDVQVDDASVAPGDTVTVTATVENAGDASGSYNATLAVGNESDVVDSTDVTVDADGERTLTLSTSFDEAGEYEVHLANQTVTVTVSEPDTPTETETETETEDDESAQDASDSTSETETETTVEDDEDVAGGGDAPDDADSTGATGPGFGITAVVVATLLGAAARYRNW